MHQFVVRPIVPLEVGGVDLSFTNASLFMMLAVTIILTFFALAFRHPQSIPGRLQSLAEMGYHFIGTMINDTIGEKGRPYFPLVFSLFFFVLVGNLLGMVPYSFTFTSHIIVTFSLAMLVFVFVTILGIVKHGLHFFSLFMPKGVPLFMAPILVPIEMLSYFSRPISLSVRLFANMMAGHTMLKVFAGFCIALGFFGVGPLVINIALTGFEVLVAVLQAYVFTILTCLYINDAIHLH